VIQKGVSGAYPEEAVFKVLRLQNHGLMNANAALNAFNALEGRSSLMITAGLTVLVTL